MKFRNGFVSNSSSSSFMIFGVCIDESDVRELLKLPTDCICDSIDENSDDVCGYCEGDDLWEHLEKLEIQFHEDPENAQVYFGMDVHEMGDDETKKQFQDRVTGILKEKFGEAGSDPDWICETIYG